MPSKSNQTFSLRLLLIGITALASFFAYFAIVIQADRTPRTIHGRVLDQSNFPIEGAILLPGPIPGPRSARAASTSAVEVIVSDNGIFPNVIVAHPTSRLLFTNKGTRGCCLKIDFRRAAIKHFTLAPGEQHSVTPAVDEHGFIDVSGTIRPKLAATLVIAGDFGCITDASGRWELHDMLPGTYSYDAYAIGKDGEHFTLSRGSCWVPDFFDVPRFITRIPDILVPHRTALREGTLDAP